MNTNIAAPLTKVILVLLVQSHRNSADAQCYHCFYTSALCLTHNPVGPPNIFIFDTPWLSGRDRIASLVAEQRQRRIEDGQMEFPIQNLVCQGLGLNKVPGLLSVVCRG